MTIINESKINESATLNNKGKTNCLYKGAPVWIVFSVVLCVGALVAKEYLRIPVKLIVTKPETAVVAPTPALPAPIQIPANIDKSVKDKNDRALKFFENRVSQIITDSEARLGMTTKKFGGEISTFNSCSYLIYLMAYDKVKSSSESETTKYFNTQIEKAYNPIFARINKELDVAVEKFKQDLMENGVSFATDLCQHFNPNDKFNNLKFVNIQSEEDFNNALRQLGLTGGILTIAVPLDILFVVQAQIFKTLIKNVVTTIGKLFARPIAVAVGSVVIAAADGPLPIGDALAVVGLIWTAYDVWSTKAEFEKEIQTSMTNFSTELSISQKKQMHDIASNLLKSHESIQDRIRNKYLNPGL